MERFDASIDCLEPRGCPVVLRVSYHPNFVVKGLCNAFVFSGLLIFVTKGRSSSILIPTFSVAPSFLAFTVPFGIDDYTVSFQRPYWQTLLAYACAIFMVVAALVGFPLRRMETKKPKPKTD